MKFETLIFSLANLVGLCASKKPARGEEVENRVAVVGQAVKNMAAATGPDASEFSAEMKIVNEASQNLTSSAKQDPTYLNNLKEFILSVVNLHHKCVCVSVGESMKHLDALSSSLSDLKTTATTAKEIPHLRFLSTPSSNFSQAIILSNFFTKVHGMEALSSDPNLTANLKKKSDDLCSATEKLKDKALKLVGTSLANRDTRVVLEKMKEIEDSICILKHFLHELTLLSPFSFPSSTPPLSLEKLTLECIGRIKGLMEKKKKDPAMMQLAMALQLSADKFSLTFVENNNKLVSDIIHFFSIIKKIRNFLGPEPVEIPNHPSGLPTGLPPGGIKGGHHPHFVAQLGKGVDYQYRVGLLCVCGVAVRKSLGEADEEEKFRLRVILHESCALLEALLATSLGKKQK